MRISRALNSSCRERELEGSLKKNGFSKNDMLIADSIKDTSLGDKVVNDVG